jgi:hypothetical protein
MRPIIIESPYAGDVERNVAYARRALRHSLDLGEAPFASHLLYTQVLDDTIPADRDRGINAGLAMANAVTCWIADRAERQGTLLREDCAVAAFYVDYGWSRGMEYARAFYNLRGLIYITRTIGT